MRILGIDYGTKRIGLAMSDPSGIIASPYKVLQSEGMRKDIDNIDSICKENNINTIVLGLPINMNGSLGERAEATQKFGDVLSRVTQIELVYRDERMTTISAERVLIEGDVRREKRKDYIDKIAAQIILQTYLDSKK